MSQWLNVAENIWMLYGVRIMVFADRMLSHVGLGLDQFINLAK